MTRSWTRPSAKRFMFHFADIKAYALLVTFQKSEREFSPSTMYEDYPDFRAFGVEPRLVSA